MLGGLKFDHILTVRESTVTKLSNYIFNNKTQLFNLVLTTLYNFVQHYLISEQTGFTLFSNIRSEKH